MSIEDQQFRKFVDDLKDKAELVDIIQAVSPDKRFSQRGKWWVCNHPDSLMVDARRQQYTYFGNAGTGGHQWETGDVFDYLMRYNNMDFWGACQWLAGRLGISMPRNMGERSEEQAKIIRERGEINSVAHAWFHDQLRRTAAAMDYLRRADGGRAFSDETICYQVTAADVLAPAAGQAFSAWQWAPETVEKANQVVETQRATTVVVRGAGLGYSGGTPAAAEDLRKTFEMYSIDPTLPAAVALCGLRGGVKAWCEKHGVEAQSNWLDKDRIYGMADFPRLVYPHEYQGKVRYFTGRGLAWDGERLIGDPDKAHKSWNPPVVLSGDRQRYYNWLFNRRAESVVIVEGQGDAIALGELGFAAVALCGVAADQALADILKDVKYRYVALDADQAGQKAMFGVGQIFGPMARLVEWSEGRGRDEEEELDEGPETETETTEEKHE